MVARTGTNEQTGRGLLSLFVVDVDAPGLEQYAHPHRAPRRRHAVQLFFDDVEVSADRLVGTEHEGLAVVFHGLNPERIMAAALSIGTGALRARTGLRLRELAHGLERPHRRAPGASRIRWPRPRSSWSSPPDDGEGLLALRRGTRGAGEAANMAKYAAAEAALACSTRRSRSTAATASRGVRAARPVLAVRPPRPHRPREPRDGPELRGRALAGTAQVLLSTAEVPAQVAERRLRRRLWYKNP